MVGQLRRYTDSDSTDKIRKCKVKAVVEFQTRSGALSILEVSEQKWSYVCVLGEQQALWSLDISSKHN